MSSPNSGSFLMTRLPWVIAALAVIALLLTLFWTRTDSGGADNANEQAMQEMQSRLEALEGGQGGSGSGTGARADGSGMAGPAGSGNPVDPLTGAESRTPEQVEAERTRELKALESAFARDKADPVRGGQVERTLEQTVTGESMAGTGLKPDDVAVDCRATTCRVVGQFASRGDAEDWALFYVTSAGGNVLTQTRMAYVTRPDGTTEVRIYATRAR